MTNTDINQANTDINQANTDIDQANTDINQERARLIDHFKRAYQIIVGLAITLACTKLFSEGVVRFPLDVSFWLFCAFFITVVPIFHGGDRSLDFKYLRAEPAGFWFRIGYVWDVYILLITAILFVKIAQAIPTQTPVAGQLIPTFAQPSIPQHFYEWMAIMLFFDVGVLVIDGLKSSLLRTYAKWIVLNLIFALVCLWAAGLWPDRLPVFSVEMTGKIVFACACLRTFLDYAFGGDFMFP